MAFIQPADVAVGDATEASNQNAQNDSIADLNSRLSGVTDETLANGSFEHDLDVDGEPDNWDITDSDGGSHSISDLTAAGDAIHGKRSLQCVTNATGGRVEALSDTFLPISEDLIIRVKGYIRASVGSNRTRIQILYYSAAQSLVATDTLLDSTNTPTAWVRIDGTSTAPATAFFFKVKLFAGESGSPTTAGSIFFDGFNIEIPIITNALIFSQDAAVLTSLGATDTTEFMTVYLPPGMRVLGYAYEVTIAVQVGEWDITVQDGSAGDSDTKLDVSSGGLGTFYLSGTISVATFGLRHAAADGIKLFADFQSGGGGSTCTIKRLLLWIDE